MTPPPPCVYTRKYGNGEGKGFRKEAELKDIKGIQQTEKNLSNGVRRKQAKGPDSQWAE